MPGNGLERFEKVLVIFLSSSESFEDIRKNKDIWGVWKDTQWEPKHTHTHTHTHTKSSGKVNDIWHATFEIEFFKKIACNNWPKLQPNLLVKITKINYFSLNVFTKIHGIKSVDKNQVKDHSSDKVISIAEVIVSLTGPESAIGFVARMRFKQSVVLPRKNTRFDSSFYMSQKINVSALNFHENWKIRLNAKMRYYNNKTCFLYMNP